MNPLSPIDAAYIAGFIDGEGCIAYSKYMQDGRTYYQLAVTIANTNLEVLDWICLVLGEGKPRALKRYGNRKQQYSVRWCYNVAIELLEQVHPHLKIKKTRAELVLAICKKNKETITTKGVPAELLAQREEVYLQMKELNKRGIN